MIAALGTSLSAATTADGVETEGELDVVRSAGCSQIQGYLLSRSSISLSYKRSLKI